jgi:hypothetical protein
VPRSAGQVRGRAPGPPVLHVPGARMSLSWGWPDHPAQARIAGLTTVGSAPKAVARDPVLHHGFKIGQRGHWARLPDAERGHRETDGCPSYEAAGTREWHCVDVGFGCAWREACSWVCLEQMCPLPGGWWIHTSRALPRMIAAASPPAADRMWMTLAAPRPRQRKQTSSVDSPSCSTSRSGRRRND